MATTTDGKVIEVFKYESTGLVALCEEVAQAKSWLLAQGADLASARFQGDNGVLKVVFDVVHPLRGHG